MIEKNIVNLCANPEHFSAAMFGDDLIHNDYTGRVSQIVTKDHISPEPGQEALFHYLAPQENTGATGPGIVVVQSTQAYQSRLEKIHQRETLKHDEVQNIEPVRTVYLIASMIGPLAYMRSYGDVWRNIHASEAFAGDVEQLQNAYSLLQVGDALAITVNKRGDWQVADLPFGHVYHKPTAVPEEVVRHVLVTELLQSLNV